MNNPSFLPPPEIANLLASTRTAVMLVDSSLKIRWFTTDFRDRCGYPEESVGNPIERYLSGFSYPNIISDLRQVLETGERIETTIAGRSLVTYLCCLASYTGPGDSQPGVLISLVDASEVAESPVRDGSASGLQSVVFATSFDGVITVDETGVITDLNPSMERLLGIDARMLRGNTLEDVRLGGGPGHSLYETLNCIVRGVAGWTSPRLIKIRGKRPDGSAFVCELNWTVAAEKSGRKFAFILSDIGRTELAEHEAVARRNLFEATVSNVAVGISVIDNHGNWLMVNDRICGMLGYSRDELMQLSPWDVTHPADVAGSRQRFSRMVQGEVDSFQIEKRYVRRDGAVFWGLVTVARQKDHLGNSVRSIAIVQDISKAKRLEAKLRKSVRSREMFLATLSHEFRNPLSAMLNASLLLGEESAEGTRTWKDALEIIRGNIRLMGSMLEDLLDLSRFANAKVRLRKRPLDMRALVLRSADTLQHSFKARNHELSMEIDGLGSYVSGDAGRLEQAVVNLLTNANKYTPAGGRIGCCLTVVDDRVVLSVTDSGCGIPREFHGKVFEPFFQMRHTLDRSQGGMGLGLPLVRMIARAHEGDVTVLSAGEGKGSTFVLSLPLCRHMTDDNADLATMPISGLKLLVVDDHPAIRLMLRQVLEIRGCQVEIAADANTALDRIDSFNPDIGLIDIGLPGMDGYQLAERIRETRPFSQLMLVAITGFGREIDRKKSLESGFDLHLVKPLDADDMIEAIIEHRSQLKSHLSQ